MWYECFLAYKDPLNTSGCNLTCQRLGDLLSCDNDCIAGFRMYNIHDSPLALNLLWIKQIRVCSLDLLLVVNDHLTETTTRVNLVNDSGELGNDCLTLWLAGFEELDNTEETTDLLFSNLQELLHLALLLTLLAFAIST